MLAISDTRRHGVAAATFLIVGVNHRTGPQLLRERLQGDAGDVLRLLGRCRETGITQAMAVATCDRCEVWCVTPDSAAAQSRLAGLLAEAGGVSEAEIAPRLHALTDAGALRYAFAVAASLESQIVGEPQVLGQVKESQQLAQHAGMSGPELDRILEAAYQAAKRVRHDTGIAGQSVSMAACAVSVLRRMHGDVSGLSGLVIGDGDMAELIFEQVSATGMRRWTMVHPQERRAKSWAERNHGHWRPFGELREALAASDLVVSALDLGAELVSVDMVKAALKARKRRPIFLIDSGVPGDMDSRIAELDDAFLYTLDDLERLAMAGRQHRAGEAEEAWRIIDQSVASFRRQLTEQEAAPAIADLHRHFEQHRAEVLAQSGIDASEATRRLINRLLHHPSVALKAAVPGRDLEAALRRLFGLNEGEKK
ncbi:MAG TPA: glutamyl-tRNA reductase [Dongiaceae bacterium]